MRARLVNDAREPLKIQSAPKCPTRGRRSATGKSSSCGVVSKERKKFHRDTYDLYVSKKFFMQRSITSHSVAVFWRPSGMASSSISWDEMWIFRGSRKCDCHIPGSCTACCYIGSLQD